MGRKEMLFLSFIFTHHFCRWKEDLQNLLSMAIQASSGKQRKIKLCFVKVSLYSTGIGFKILWKAKIGDSAVAFVQAFNMLAPELSEGFSAVLVSSPETKPGVAGQGMLCSHPSCFHWMCIAGTVRIKQTDLASAGVFFQRSD